MKLIKEIQIISNMYRKRENGSATFGQKLRETEDKYDFAREDDSLIDMDDITISSSIIDESIEEFDRIGGDDVNELLLRAIYSMGFERPSRVQKYAIPQIIKGKDIIAQSQSGTGKTGAYAISSIYKINPNLKKPQHIILLPTRDLADQTLKIMSDLIKNNDKLKISYTVGNSGIDRRTNLEQLSKGGCQFIIATPGRLLDMMNANISLFSNINMLIVDECDELLSNNFKDTLKEIIQNLNANCQICLFSATFTSEVIKLSKNILRPDHVKILIKKECMTLNGITQTYLEVEGVEEKIARLCDVLKVIMVQQYIVYVNSIDMGMNLREILLDNDITTGFINGEMEMRDRVDVLADFKKGVFKCLIATDVLARGIDIQHLSLVINFDMTDDISKYIHRIGRSGRYGKKGFSINFIDKNSRNRNGPNDVQIQTLIRTTFRCEIVNLTTIPLETLMC